jgi:RNA recognition motif-containing protein
VPCAATSFDTQIDASVCSLTGNVADFWPDGCASALPAVFEDPCMRIYVGNLSLDTGEPQLQELFSRVGAVESVHLVRDRATGRSRGLAFVEMLDENQGHAACEQLDQREFEGRRLTVTAARPQERRGFGHEARW